MKYMTCDLCIIYQCTGLANILQCICNKSYWEENLHAPRPNFVMSKLDGCPVAFTTWAPTCISRKKLWKENVLASVSGTSSSSNSSYFVLYFISSTIIYRSHSRSLPFLHLLKHVFAIVCFRCNEIITHHFSELSEKGISISFTSMKVTMKSLLQIKPRLYNGRIL